MMGGEPVGKGWMGWMKQQTVLWELAFCKVDSVYIWTVQYFE